MDSSKKNLTTIDEYIKTFPKEVQTTLQRIRETIHKAIPEANETISYQMPTFKFNGKNLVYFAAWSEHIGFYATPGGNEAFRKELSPYKQAKGSVHFPLNEPMPYELIAEIAKFRMQEIVAAGKKEK